MARNPKNVRLTRRPPEDIPDWVPSAWDVIERDTNRYLGYVEANEIVDYRAQGRTRHGTPGTAYVSGIGWLAYTPEGKRVSDDLDTRSLALSDLLRHHGITAIWSD